MGSEGWLLEKDTLRYFDPSATHSDLMRAAEEGRISLDLLPLWCGVTGSCLRLMLRYDDAMETLNEGLECALESDDLAMAGDLHQRLSMVWWATMHFDEALQENCRALAMHAEAANPIGMGRSLVDRGIVLGSQGLFQRSTDCFARGLEELPGSELRHKATALHGIGHNLLEQGHRTEAKAYLEEAEELPLDPLNQAKLIWVTGKALCDKGSYESGLLRLHRATETLCDLAPNCGIIANIDLVAAYLQKGDGVMAHQLAAEMLKVIPAIKNRRAVEVATMELVNLGLAGKGLTLSILEAKKKKVSHGRLR